MKEGNSMRIGIIGLGDIARKAYLPVITAKEGIELVFCTRNTQTLYSMAKKYRIEHTVSNLDELIKIGVDAAFVHSATEAHAEIVEKLLKNNIHVYVDKPISYSLEDALKLAEVSEKTDKILMVGFNRRFAPMYQRLKAVEAPDIIIMQKNRLYHPDNIRRFVFDDFIHVVDTLRFLSKDALDDMDIRGLVKDESLYNVKLELKGKDFTSIGIMNRNSGKAQETLEFMNPGNKWLIKDMNETVHLNNGTEQIIKFGDWDPVLYRRGFEQIINHFIDSVQNNTKPSISINDSLITHEICENIVKELSKVLK
jgi:virulence factor